MLSFMQKNRGAFDFVERDSEKIRVKRHYLERKIRGGVSVFLFDRGVQPVIVGAVSRQIIKEKCFVGKTSAFENSDR